MSLRIAVVTVALLLIAGCGSDDGETDAAEDEAPDPCQVVAEDGLSRLVGREVRFLDAVVYDDLDEVACNVDDTGDSVAITWSLTPATGSLEEMARDEGALFGDPTSRSVALSGETPALELTYESDPAEPKARLLTVVGGRLIHASVWNEAPGPGMLSGTELVEIATYVADAYARAEIDDRA